jgi:LPS export ABC transporter protein LptC
VALLAGGGLLASCQDGAPVATLTQDISAWEGADGITIKGEHVFLNAEGFRASHLVFDTMYQWADSADHFIRGVNLRVYNEDGTERAHVTSRQGVMDPRGERLVAQGNVVLIVPADGRRLESGELHYDPNADRIWSDSSFVMTHQGSTFRGSSFVSDVEFRNFQSTGPGGGG